VFMVRWMRDGTTSALLGVSGMATVIPPRVG
jgi:hypothetical protein